MRGLVDAGVNFRCFELLIVFAARRRISRCMCCIKMTNSAPRWASCGQQRWHHHHRISEEGGGLRCRYTCRDCRSAAISPHILVACLQDLVVEAMQSTVQSTVDHFTRCSLWHAVMKASPGSTERQLFFAADRRYLRW